MVGARVQRPASRGLRPEAFLHSGSLEKRDFQRRRPGRRKSAFEGSGHASIRQCHAPVLFVVRRGSLRMLEGEGQVSCQPAPWPHSPPFPLSSRDLPSPEAASGTTHAFPRRGLLDSRAPASTRSTELGVGEGAGTSVRCRAGRPHASGERVRLGRSQRRRQVGPGKKPSTARVSKPAEDPSGVRSCLVPGRALRSSQGAEKSSALTHIPRGDEGACRGDRLSALSVTCSPAPG